jgi:hypothetical protein
MTLKSLLGFSDANLHEGTPEQQQEARRQELHAQRVEAARGTLAWTELEPVDVVTRQPYLISASTDEMFVPHRGLVFEPGSASAVADQSPLWFVVDGDELLFLEKPSGASTYTQFLEAKAERERTRNAPKPRPQ